MSDRYQLIAYLATLATLILVLTLALVAAVIEPSLIGRLEAFGLGTITGGLIGVLRLPTRAGVNVESAGQVGPNGGAAPAPDPQPATPPPTA